METINAKDFLEYVTNVLDLKMPSSAEEWLQFADSFGDHKKKEAVSNISSAELDRFNQQVSFLLDSLAAVRAIQDLDESTKAIMDVKIKEIVKAISI